jgi:hypothetical protein
MYVRHYLQRSILSKEYFGKEAHEYSMEEVSEYINIIDERRAELDISTIRATKINKVFKAVLKLTEIPREREFQIRKRCQALLEECDKILADEDVTSVSSRCSENHFSQGDAVLVAFMNGVKSPDVLGLSPPPGKRQVVGQTHARSMSSIGYTGGQYETDRSWDKLRSGETRPQSKSSIGYTSDEEEIAPQSDEQHSEERRRARSVSSIGYTDSEGETFIPYPRSDPHLQEATEERYAKSMLGMSHTDDREQAAVTPKPSKPNQSMDIDAPVGDAQLRTADGDDSRESSVITAEFVLKVLGNRGFFPGKDFLLHSGSGSRCLHYDCVSYNYFMPNFGLLEHFGDDHPRAMSHGSMRPTGYNGDDGKWSRFLCPLKNCVRHHLLIPVRIPVMETDVNLQLAKWHLELGELARLSYISPFFLQLRLGIAVQPRTLKPTVYQQQPWFAHDNDINYPEAGKSMLFLCPDCDKEIEPLLITNTMDELRIGLEKHIRERHRPETSFVSYSAILDLIKRGSFKPDHRFKRNEILHITP